MSALARPLAATSPTWGAAGSYSVLGHTTVTNTGPTSMVGDLGVDIGVVTDLGALTVGPPGAARNTADSLAAQNDNTAVFLALSAAPNVACDTTYPGASQDLVGLTLPPGIYCATAFTLSGALILDALANPAAVWIFRSASTLITSSGVGANVTFLNGVGSPCNVWWKVVSSATIGTGTSFVGNILASTSIALQTNATLNGRALAQTGAVTLDSNTITGTACLTAPIVVPPVVDTTTDTTDTTNTTDLADSGGRKNSSANAISGLPDTGGAPIRNDAFPWNLAVAAGFSTMALVLGVRAYRRSRLPK